MAEDLSNARFKRGAYPSPRHKLLAADPYVRVEAPPQFAVIPPKLSMWDNDHDGDCVTAEEAFALAAFSVMSGNSEVFVPDAEVIRWAKKYGFLNGATLTDVMDVMLRDGLTAVGVNYKNGPHKGVNYADEPTLKSALTVGPVKIAIDAAALPGAAGNHSGWFAVGSGHFPNTDHCVALTGYGPAGWLFGQLGVALPAGLDAAHQGYLLFTWNTIGFVDHAWLMGTCVEAWVRNPTSPQVAPGPAPDPNPDPPPPAPKPQVVRVPALPSYGPHGRVVSTSRPVTLPVEDVSAGQLWQLDAYEWMQQQQIMEQAREQFLTGMTAVPEAPPPAALPWTQIIALLLKYGPYIIQLLPVIMSPQFKALTPAQKAMWIAAAIAAIQGGQPVPPLPK